MNEIKLEQKAMICKQAWLINLKKGAMVNCKLDSIGHCEVQEIMFGASTESKIAVLINGQWLDSFWIEPIVIGGLV